MITASSLGSNYCEINPRFFSAFIIFKVLLNGNLVEKSWLSKLIGGESTKRCIPFSHALELNTTSPGLMLISKMVQQNANTAT